MGGCIYDLRLGRLCGCIGMSKGERVGEIRDVIGGIEGRV